MSLDTVKKLHETLLKRSEALASRDTRKANRLYDRGAALFEEMQKDLRPEVVSAFLSLLDEPDPRVRSSVASMALLIDPERAVPVLEELARQVGGGGASTNAEYMLRKWRSGETIKFR